MADFDEGLFGKVKGSIANVVISSRNGKPYIRAKPEQVSNPRTAKQQATRMRLSLLSGMLRRFKGYIKAGFTHPPKGKSSRDVAYRANYPLVFSGEYPDIRLDYSRAVLSQGRRAAADITSCHHENGRLQLSWKTQDETAGHAPDDVLRLLVFNEARDEVFIQLQAGQRRNGQIELILPDAIQPATPEQHLHVWISFASPGLKKVSDSVYASP